MKNIYWAIQRAIYRSTSKSHLFGRGNSPYPASLAKAFVEFEKGNRGHKDLLSTTYLNIASRETAVLGNSRAINTIREKVAATLFNVFQALLMTPKLPATVEMEDVLGAVDTQGYLLTFFRNELVTLVGDIEFTAHTSFELHNLRLELGTKAPVVHLQIKLRGEDKVIRKSISLDAGDPNTLGGAYTLYNDARRKFDELLDDVSAWPEFKAKLESGTAAQHQATELEQDVAAAQAVAKSDGMSHIGQGPQQALSEADQVLLARLKNDLQFVFKVYSAETREFMHQHWDALRSVVPEDSRMT